jgi:hypothetical protein
MAKITLNNLTTNYGSQALFNANSDTIEDHLNNKVLYRDNPSGEPNTMENQLDMNSNRIINLAAGVLNSDAVTLAQLNATATGGSTVSQSRETQLGSDATARVFTLSGLSYTVGSNVLAVYRNGQRLERTEDYSETSSSSVTLTFDPNASDRFVFITNDVGTSEVTTTDAITHNSQSLSNIIDSTPRYFATVADFQASEEVQAGQPIIIGERANALFDIASGGSGANTYNVIANTAGTFKATLRQRANTIYPIEWGAKLDGATDDTLVLRAISDYINTAAGGYTVDFGDTTNVLISYQGAAYASVYGYVVMDFVDAPNTHLKGKDVTVTCVNHNITTYGGFRFANFAGCPNHSVEGFYFDMTFTGANTSGSFYPWCGAIVSSDGSGGAFTQDQINSNCRYSKLRFKLYHEKGSFMQSPNSFPGDNNNGFKIFSLFNNGDYLATDYDNQHRNITYNDITFEKGHNAYGIWTWAYNDVTYDGIHGLDYVSKYSTSAGAVGGVGMPMLRYYQWHCSGLKVDNIYFRAKPCSERTTVGFEGNATMINLNSGMGAGAYTHGLTTFGGNIVCILGRGDGANGLMDYGIHMFHYGITTIGAMVCDSTTETTNAAGGNETHIRWAGEVDGGEGFAQLNIGKLSFGPNCDRSTNIDIANGADTAADRRLKQLTIDQIQSYGQLQYCISINSTGVAYGVQDVHIGKVLINGTENSVYNSASSNSRALQLSCSEATDTITIDSLTVRDKYYVAVTDQMNCTIGNAVINDLKVSGITAYWTTDVPVVHMTGTGTPEAAVPANLGSTFHRANGGAATSFYVKETGTGNTGWVGK